MAGIVVRMARRATGRASRADQDALPYEGWIAHLLDEKVRDVRPGDRGEAPQRELLADAIAAGLRSIRERDGIHEGPVEAAAADLVVSNLLVGVEVAQQQAYEDARHRRHLRPGRPHAVRRRE